MILTEVPLMIDAYKKQKSMLGKVLDSPKPYLEDVCKIMGDLWNQEQAIIARTGTIYNGL